MPHFQKSLNSLHRAGLLLVACCVAGNAAAQSLKVTESNATITLAHDDKTIVVYNKVSPPVPDGMKSVYHRSGCLHPVTSPLGRTVTQMFPFDHPHQHGIFSAWVNTTYGDRKIDFWNLGGGSGRVLHERVVSTFEEDGTAGFEVDLIHRAEQEPQIDILRERWKVTARPTDGTYHCFDLETTQTALTDTPLVINKYHYGGVALRGPTRWLSPKDSDIKNAAQRQELEPSEFLNDLGSDRQQGNHEHAKWVALTGRIDGKPVSIAVLCHAANFHAPQAARIHPSKPYFAFSPCVDDAFQIDREHPYKAQYRFLVNDAEPNADWINGEWDSWCGQ